MNTESRLEGPGSEEDHLIADTGGFDREPVRVNLVFYLVSILVVALLVFVVMLIQYLPGYRTSHRLSEVIKNSDVEISISIPMSEVEVREPNPFTPKQRDAVIDMLMGMGARSARVTIEPEGAQ